MSKKKNAAKVGKKYLTRLESIATRTDVPDMSKLKPHELSMVVVGSLYIIRDIIEGLDPNREDIHDMQVAENKIRQSVIQLMEFQVQETGGKGGSRKTKRRARSDP
jgi:hypothetical protein